MPSMLYARPLPVKKYRTKAMQGYILDAMLDSSGAVLSDLEQTIQHWRHHVEFKVHITFAKDARLTIWTYDIPWNLLDQGTSVRYARGSKGFVPKTTPGTFRSGAGAGYMKPSRKRYPGIKPRGWTLMAVTKHTKEFNQRVVAAMAKGFASPG